jgi:hypothetical protein
MSVDPILQKIQKETENAGVLIHIGIGLLFLSGCVVVGFFIHAGWTFYETIIH